MTLHSKPWWGHDDTRTNSGKAGKAGKAGKGKGFKAAKGNMVFAKGQGKDYAKHFNQQDRSKSTESAPPLKKNDRWHKDEEWQQKEWENGSKGFTGGMRVAHERRRARSACSE